MMEDVADAASVAGEAAFVLAGAILALVSDHHDGRRIRPAERLGVINSSVGCLDGPEQHREHDREQAAEQTIGLQVAARGRRTRISLRVDEQISERLCM